LIVDGEQRYQQRVREWNSDDFDRTFLLTSPETRSDRFGKRQFGEFLVLIEGSEFHPETAWIFRLNGSKTPAA
jgi:hypothetical protein